MMGATMNLSETDGYSDFQLKAGQEVASCWIQYDSVELILREAVEMVIAMQAIKMPAGILIQAQSGMGKTELLQVITQEVNRRIQSKMGESRCINIELDSTVDAIRMAGHFTKAVGYPLLPSRAKQETMNSMIENALDRLAPVLVTIDETQHITEGNREIWAKGVTDWLKVRMDKHNFPIVCAGSKGIEKLCSINPQFTSRASVNFVIEPFRMDDRWLRLLAGFASAVKLVDMRIITTVTSKKLYQATNGNIRALKRILVYAALSAASRESRVMQLQDLAIGYTKSFGVMPSLVNPFEVK
jgi:Bacterial TniB protein